MWRKRNKEGHYSSSHKDSALTRERLLQELQRFNQVIRISDITTGTLSIVIQQFSNLIRIATFGLG